MVRREKTNSCSPYRWDIDFHGFAQTAEQIIEGRRKVFVGWLGIVNFAEAKYKSKHRVYGNLTALRHAHLLDALVFESNVPSSPPDSSLIPVSTGFRVTVSRDRKNTRLHSSHPSISYAVFCL